MVSAQRYLMAIAGLILSSTDAHATAIRDCAGVVGYNTTAIQRDYALQASLLQIIDEQKFNQLRDKGWFVASLQGLGLATEWDKFQEQRSSFHKALKWDHKVDYSEGILARALSDTSLKAFQDCVTIALDKGGVKITDFQQGNDTAIVSARIAPTPGLKPPFNIYIVVTNGCVFNQKQQCVPGLKLKASSLVPNHSFQLRLNSPSRPRPERGNASPTATPPDSTIIIGMATTDDQPIDDDKLLVPYPQPIHAIEREIPLHSPKSEIRGGWSTGGREKAGADVCADRVIFDTVPGEIGRVTDWKRTPDGRIQASPETTYLGSEENRGSPGAPSAMKLKQETLSGARPCGYAWVYPPDDDVEYIVQGQVIAWQWAKMFYKSQEASVNYRSEGTATSSAVNPEQPDVAVEDLTVVPAFLKINATSTLESPRAQ